MKYYNLNKTFYDGFAYQIPFNVPVHWAIVDWVCEDIDNRRWRRGLHASDRDKHYVELKNEEDLVYFMLKWA
jgi:hypothetical protein